MGMGGMGGGGGMRSFRQDPAIVKQQIKRGTTKRMAKFALPYVWLLVGFMVIVVLSAGVNIANPLIFREIIDKGILKSDIHLTIVMAVLAALLAISNSALGLMQTYISAKIGTNVVLSLRTKLYEHIQIMPLAFFTRAQTGSLVSRLNNDVQGAQSAFTDILSNVVGNIITVVGVLGAMLVLSWQMTLAALVLLPFFIFPARWWGAKLRDIQRETYSVTALMNNLMVERFTVGGAQLAKIFGRPKDESVDFEGRAARVSRIGVKRAVYGRMFFTALTLTATLATCFAYGWGGVMAARHVISVGTLVAFVSYLQRLYQPLAGLSNLQISLMTALVSFERVFEVLDLPPMIEEKPKPIAVPFKPTQIVFDHVTFRYPVASEISLASLETVVMPEAPPDRPILDDVSFVAEPGQIVALVGPSGAGKTTITQLLCRMYDVQGGAVRINGVDVRDASMESLYRLVGTVTQDPHLFHDTIRNNLLYARPDATEGEIIEALNAAQILPLVLSLPNGLDTIVGQQGYRFSGGEKQRLAIARVLLKAPEIVILDEATAHLDSESEAAIQEALEIALRQRTSIVIAHRLSTIQRADQILVVQEGHIVERGKHAELLARHGRYAELFRRQTASPDEVDVEIDA